MEKNSWNFHGTYVDTYEHKHDISHDKQTSIQIDGKK